MAGIPVALPEGLEPYGRSPEFTDVNLPKKLMAAHATKAGTWGVLRVLAGTVRFILEPPETAVVIASADEEIIIEPGVEHRVSFVTPGRFFITFYRQGQPGESLP